MVAQSLLVLLTLDYERARAQDQVEAAAAAAAADIRQALARQQQSLQALPWNEPPAGAVARRRRRRCCMRAASCCASSGATPRMRIVDAVDSPYQAPLFTPHRRARRSSSRRSSPAPARSAMAAPAFSRSYFVPLADGLGLEVIDLCVPLQRAGEPDGFVVATLSLAGCSRKRSAPSWRAATSCPSSKATARAWRAPARGAAPASIVAERVVDLPGQTLQLRVDSSTGRPSLIPNLAVALVLGLSLALAAVVLLLARDVRRRAARRSRAWPRRWPSARRWRIRSSPACARAT